MFGDLDIRQLEALCAVVDEGTFGRAATALGFTQSAVSQQIAGLERACGLPLFDRPGGPKRPTLTPAGVLLLDHARAVLAQLRTAAEELDRLRRGVAGTLRIGTFQSVATQVLPTVIGRLLEDHPDIDIRLTQTDEQDVLIDQLLADDLDLVFLVDLADDPRLDIVTLGHDPYVLIAHPDHATPGSFPVADLDNRPMVAQPPVSVCHLLVEAYLHRERVRPDYVFRSSDNGAVQAMVRSGMGPAIMPFLAIDPSDPGIAVLELDPPMVPRHVSLGRRRGRTLIPAADRLQTIAVEVCRELLGQVPAH